MGLLFCFAWIYGAERDLNSFRPRAPKRPGGAFLGRGARAVRTALFDGAAPYGVLLFVLHGFMEQEERIEQPRAETPRWGF